MAPSATTYMHLNSDANVRVSTSEVDKQAVISFENYPIDIAIFLPTEVRDRLALALVEVDYQEIASHTDPSKIYIVTLVNNHPKACTCPDFCFRIVPSKGTHRCKHMESLAPQLDTAPDNEA